MSHSYKTLQLSKSILGRGKTLRTAADGANRAGQRPNDRAESRVQRGGGEDITE
nr:hypothetical protein [Microbispora sp.]